MTAVPKVEEPTIETVTYRRQKQKGQREVKFENLPVETIDYCLDQEEQICSCCGGLLHEMSTEVRKELQVIPAQVKVVKHVKHVYSCRHCEHHEIQTPIVTAKAPASVYLKSIASPSAMAYITHQKYVASLPLYRQEQEFSRFSITLSRQTMSNWVIYGAQTWLKLIYDRMYAHLLKQDILQQTRQPCRF